MATVDLPGLPPQSEFDATCLILLGYVSNGNRAAHFTILNINRFPSTGSASRMMGSTKIGTAVFYTPLPDGSRKEISVGNPSRNAWAQHFGQPNRLTVDGKVRNLQSRLAGCFRLFPSGLGGGGNGGAGGGGHFASRFYCLGAFLSLHLGPTRFLRGPDPCPGGGGHFSSSVPRMRRGNFATEDLIQFRLQRFDVLTNGNRSFQLNNSYACIVIHVWADDRGTLERGQAQHRRSR